MVQVRELGIELGNEAYTSFMASTSDVVSVEEIHEAVRKVIVENMQSGVIAPTEVAENYINLVCRRVDRMQTRAGNQKVNDKAMGLGRWIDLVDVTVPLGNGERIRFGNLTATTLLKVHRVRHTNYMAQVQAYNNWTELYLKLAELLQNLPAGVNLQSVIESGGLKDD